jgi:membrane associated rhomboid family serine protease
LLEGAIYGLLVAWVLSWFGFDDMVVQVFDEWFKTTLSIPGYYIIFFIVGGFAGIFQN